MSKHSAFKPPYFTDQKIEEICTSELKLLSLLPDKPEPIRIERFIEKKFKITPEYSKLQDGLLGYTRFGPNGVEEMVIAQALDDEGTKVSDRRIRTTLAHEAGHGLLHAYLFAIETKSRNLFGAGHDDTPRILCRDVDESGSKGKGNWQWQEVQANRAMGALLLPQPLVIKAIGPYLDSQGVLGGLVLTSKRDVAIRELADVFDVNPVVVQYRLEKLFPLTNSHQLSL